MVSFNPFQQSNQIKNKLDAAKTIIKIETFGGQGRDDSKKLKEAKDEFKRSK